MSKPLFFRPGRLVKILTGRHCAQMGTITEIVLTAEFHPLIMVKTLCPESGCVLTVPYLRGEVELLQSGYEAIMAYLRMHMPEDRAAA